MQEEVSTAAHEVRMGVMRLARRLRKERPDSGLGLTKLSVLGRLDREGPCSASELAAAEHIQPQSITRVLAELEERGLIERRPDPGDRRRTLLEIAPAGRDLITEDRRSRDEWLAHAMAGTLTDAEREFLRVAATLLDRLAET